MLGLLLEIIKKKGRKISKQTEVQAVGGTVCMVLVHCQHSNSHMANTSMTEAKSSVKVVLIAMVWCSGK